MPKPKYSLRKNNTKRDPEMEKIYGTLITDLLNARGIDNVQMAQDHLPSSPEIELGDPFTMNDMEKSIDRINTAIENNELITIHADYDCDGIPGACILSNLFNIINYQNYKVSIPDRNLEGYGLGINHIDDIIKTKSSLIITIDLGITSVEPINYAKEKGIDTIVTDHHTLPDILPDAFSIVHPKLPSSTYVNRELCGAGVIYTLVRAFEKKYQEKYNIPNNFSNSLIDLAGFATLSDMVELTAENKSLIRQAIKMMRQSPRLGFLELARASRVYLKELDQGDIAFMLAPKLNVASRMGSPYDAYDLLMATDEKIAKEKSTMLVNLSNERRKLVALMVKEAKREIARNDKDKDSVIVVGEPSWKVGLLGLVASKIVDTYNKPAFVWGRTNHDTNPSYKGSCRGNGTINVHSLMSALPIGTLLEYGGHFEAGGFSVDQENIYNLHQVFNETFVNFNEDNDETKDNQKIIDAVIPVSFLHPKLHNAINKLGPFGPGNTEPLFIFKNVNIIDIRNFGTGNAHIEISFRDKDGLTASTYAFYKKNEDVNNPQIGDIVSIIGSLDSKLWQGTVRLRLKDIIIKK